MPNPVLHSACRQSWQPLFLGLVPQIRNYAAPAFRTLRRDDHENTVQETIAQAFFLFVRLMHRGKQDPVFPTVLARFAICRVRQGRTLGTPLNSSDALSDYAQLRRSFNIDRPDQYDSRRQRRLESLIEDHRTPVIDQVWFRMDYPEWLSRLSFRRRRIAESLASGDSTNAVARQFRLCPARISQIRRELLESWEKFHEGARQRVRQAPGSVSAA
jgi:hypothetical protein